MTDVQLTLTAPAGLEEPLTRLLSGHAPAAAAGFAVRDLRGHGDAVTYRNIAEQIRGHVRMIEVTMRLPDREVGALVELLGTVLPGAGISYCTSPVLKAGRVD